jgi:ribosome-associated protein
MNDDVVVNSLLTIPLSELSFRFSRSGGPGGQNVNKVSTRVEVEFDIRQSPSLSEVQRQRLLRRLGHRLDSNGVIRIQVDDSRSQWQNRQIAVGRLGRVLSEALKVQKHRIPTRRTAASNSRRLEGKKLRGRLKRGRRGSD